jgi:hypothetical protein
MDNIGWRKELGGGIDKNRLNDPINDLTIDLWKRNAGIDVAFNHRSFDVFLYLLLIL